MFQLLDHTSDVGILARGATRDEALIETSRGLTSIIVNPADFRPLEERYFKAPGSDDAAQVVNWLNEILFFFEFTVNSWTASEIVGRARGERFDIDRHEFRSAVKAATYHQFESHAVSD